MNRLQLILFAVVLVTALAAGPASPVFAAAAPTAAGPAYRIAQEAPTASGPARDIVPFAVWMFVGVATFAIILTVFYLFKRRIGGFPANPGWVAPISIMPSSELPGDSDPHEATAPGNEEERQHARVHAAH